MRRVVIGVISCCVLGSLTAVPRSSTQDQARALCEQITNGLISIRKDFAGAQSRVCALLDQVDKMHKITKNLQQKKQFFESHVANASSSMKKISDENKALQMQNATLKQKFEFAVKELEYMHKQIEAEKKQAVQSYKVESAQAFDEKIKEKVSKTVEEEVAAQIAQIKKMAEVQSLSLTSTSAPISPR